MDSEKIRGVEILSSGSVREMILFLISMTFLLWYYINQPVLSTQALAFLVIGVIITAGFLVSVITTRSGMDLDMVLSEEGSFIFRDKRITFAIALFLGIITFFMISGTSYSVRPPAFQILNLGVWGSAFLSIWAALIENWMFFSLAPAIIFAVFHNYTRNVNYSTVMMFIFSPLTFTLFHIFVYGFEDVVSSIWTFVFGVEMLFWVFVSKDMLITHFRHAANNFSIIIFKQRTLLAFFNDILSSWIFWGIVVIFSITFYIKNINNKREGAGVRGLQ